jgi:copper chaperone CopZ
MITVLPLHAIGAEKIHCAGCETRIDYALRRLPGVRDVRARAETQQSSVTIDPTEVNRDQVRARL